LTAVVVAVEVAAAVTAVAGEEEENYF